MTSKTTFLTILGTLSLAVALTGCGLSTAEADARDRASPPLEKGISLEQVGRLDDAIAQYELTLLDHPRLFSAHLHLAILLHDYRQDYIAALYHYRQYLAKRPDTEKDDMIKQRIKLAEQLLTAQLVRRGGEIVSQTQTALNKEIEALNGRIATLEGEKAQLSADQTKLRQELEAANSEARRLRRLLDNMSPAAAEPPPERPRPSALSRILPRRESEPRGAEPTQLPPLNSDAISAARREAALMAGAATTDETPAPPPGDATRSVTLRTYVVQPGDTLFGIAERHYGDGAKWGKIRDANRRRIGADGQVRAGQILEIP